MKSDEFDQDNSSADPPLGQEVGSQEFASPQPEEGQRGSEGAAPSGNEELDALRDRYLRLAAEYDNYRKRTDRERVEGRDRAQAQIVEKLLEPLDDLQRVAQFSAENTTLDSVLEGVRMVERKLAKALEAAGLEIVEARGTRFDPAMHDALMMAPTEHAAEDDTVGEVFQTGYRFRGTLLRPARVQVRKHG
jgi:molecular chaperone GrpE